MPPISIGPNGPLPLIMGSVFLGRPMSIIPPIPVSPIAM